MSSDTASALFNATLGNAVELFIAVFALQRGLIALVEACIVGSILVLISSGFTGGSLDPALTPFQLAAVLITATFANALSPDGFCKWLEGAHLVAKYVLIVIAFVFV